MQQTSDMNQYHIVRTVVESKKINKYITLLMNNKLITKQW